MLTKAGENCKSFNLMGTMGDNHTNEWASSPTFDGLKSRTL